MADGVCYRLWSKGEEGALAAYPPAEIEAADLTGLALELALWGAEPGGPGVSDRAARGTMAEARALLQMLGALDGNGRITEHGRALAALPLHPRLGHMLVRAGAEAAPLAALMAERDPLRGAAVDLSLRLEALRDVRAFQRNRVWQVNLGALDRIKGEAKRLKTQATGAGDLNPAMMAALAYPDRIGQRRKGDVPRYVLSGGKGVVLDSDDTLAGAPYLVVTDTDGNPREARVRMAVQITESEIRALFRDQIGWIDSCDWSKRERRVVARRQERFGAITLDDRIWKDVPEDRIAKAMLDGVRDLGIRLQGVGPVGRMGRTGPRQRVRSTRFLGTRADGRP